MFLGSLYFYLLKSKKPYYQNDDLFAYKKEKINQLNKLEYNKGIHCSLGTIILETWFLAVHYTLCLKDSMKGTGWYRSVDR